MRRAMRAASGAFLLGLSLGFLFAAGEVVTRLFGGVRYGGWGDPASIHAVVRQIAYNSKGLRDREIPYEKAPGELRILCLGDSFTWGQMVEPFDTWPKVLERELSRAAPRPVTAINAGRLGWNTADEYQWYAREGVRYDPDVVVVGFFLNDAEENHYALDPLLPPALERKLAWSYFYFFLKYRIHMLKAKIGLTVAYEEYIRRLYEPQAFGWKKCRRALRLIRETTDAEGRRMLVVVIPVITDWERYPFAAIHEEIRSFCESREIPVVDALDAFRSSPASWTDLRVGPNDEHPSPAGHAIIARVVREGLAERFGLP